jgi:hypothetical protein
MTLLTMGRARHIFTSKFASIVWTPEDETGSA